MGDDPKHRTRATSRLTRRSERPVTLKQCLPWETLYQKLENGQMLSRNLWQGPSSKRGLQELKADCIWGLSSVWLTQVHIWLLRFVTMVSSRRLVGALPGTADSQNLWSGHQIDGSGIKVLQQRITQTNFLPLFRGNNWLISSWFDTRTPQERV